MSVVRCFLLPCLKKNLSLSACLISCVINKTLLAARPQKRAWEFWNYLTHSLAWSSLNSVIWPNVKETSKWSLAMLDPLPSFLTCLLWNSNSQQWSKLRSRSTKKKMMIPSRVSLIFIACSVFVGFFPPHSLCVSLFVVCFRAFLVFLLLPCPAGERWSLLLWQALLYRYSLRAVV